MAAICLVVRYCTAVHCLSPRETKHIPVLQASLILWRIERVLDKILVMSFFSSVYLFMYFIVLNILEK